MTDIIKLKSTSLTSATGNDILLRETKTTRLIFRPEMVENPHNNKASVKGMFIFQKKGFAGSWEDYKSLDLTKLKATEWVQIELKSEELLKLITELNNYYKIFECYGIRPGETEIIITSKNIKQVVGQLLQDKENLSKFIEEGGADLLSEAIRWLSSLEDKKLVIEKLKKLEPDDMGKLNSMISLNSLNNILETWKQNKNNHSEEFWQKLFKSNAWILAQVFSQPMFIFKDKAYVGGKSFDNQGGQLVDFMYKNNLTENAALIEIKTPATKLLSNQYRDNVYSVSGDLSGSINQILSYKEDLQINIDNLNRGSKQKLHPFNPKCILIIGSFEMEKLNAVQHKSFEIFRSNLKSLEILTFDELFGKIELSIQLIQA